MGQEEEEEEKNRKGIKVVGDNKEESEVNVDCWRRRWRESRWNADDENDDDDR